MTRKIPVRLREGSDDASGLASGSAPGSAGGEPPRSLLERRYRFSRLVISLAYLALLIWLVANYLGG